MTVWKIKQLQLTRAATPSLFDVTLQELFFLPLQTHATCEGHR